MEKYNTTWELRDCKVKEQNQKLWWENQDVW